VQRFPALVPLLVAGVLGGAVGGAVVLGLRAPNTPKAVKESVAPVASAEPSALEGRVLALEQTVARLSRRPVTVLSPAPAGSLMDGGTAGATVVDDPVFEVAVRDIVDRVEEERSSERDVRRDEQRRRMADTWVSELGLELGLAEAQKTKVLEIVTEMFQGLRELRNLDAGTVKRSERVARMRAVSEEAEKKLSTVLDSTQMNAYRALDEDLRLTGRSFGGRR
jgi:hypothetical protein